MTATIAVVRSHIDIRLYVRANRIFKDNNERNIRSEYIFGTMLRLTRGGLLLYLCITFYLLFIFFVLGTAKRSFDRVEPLPKSRDAKSIRFVPSIVTSSRYFDSAVEREAGGKETSLNSGRDIGEVTSFGYN